MYCRIGMSSLLGRLPLRYWLTLLFRVACVGFVSSSGATFGRSMLSVILLTFPVTANGGWPMVLRRSMR